MKKVSADKFRIIERFGGEIFEDGTHYTVEELYVVDKKGRREWYEWKHDIEAHGSVFWYTDTFSTIEKAEAEIAKRRKKKVFIPKIVKEIG